MSQRTVFGHSALWHQLNVRHWHCDVIFVDCCCMQRCKVDIHSWISVDIDEWINEYQFSVAWYSQITVVNAFSWMQTSVYMFSERVENVNISLQIVPKSVMDMKLTLVHVRPLPESLIYDQVVSPDSVMRTRNLWLLNDHSFIIVIIWMALKWCRQQEAMICGYPTKQSKLMLCNDTMKRRERCANKIGGYLNIILCHMKYAYSFIDALFCCGCFMSS